jgi:transcriptional regulator with XRE-family HTH domain
MSTTQASSARSPLTRHCACGPAKRLRKCRRHRLHTLWLQFSSRNHTAQMSDSIIDRRSSRTPTWVDTYIGRRIQQRRAEFNMSQTRLGELVGLTFQQIQKFESGANRVAASRLADIAAVLKASPGDFFPPTSDAAPRLQRGDLDQTLEAIAAIIERHEQSIAELQGIYHRLASLGQLEPGGASNGRIKV